MNQIERIEKIISLKEQIDHMYSINCPKLAAVLQADLEAIPDGEEITV